MITKNILKKTWILACHINEIKNKNDYKTLDYFGLPVIIYNINNDYFSYVNVCPHRGSKIKIKNMEMKYLIASITDGLIVRTEI